MGLPIEPPGPRPALSVLDRVKQFPHFPREGIDKPGGTYPHSDTDRNVVLLIGVVCPYRIQRGVDVLSIRDLESFRRCWQTRIETIAFQYASPVLLPAAIKRLWRLALAYEGCETGDASEFFSAPSSSALMFCIATYSGPMY